MTPSRTVALAAVATLASIIIVAALPEDIASETAIESKVAWREDGGKVYVVPVVLRDGTFATKETFDAPCKRRPRGVDGSQCQRVSLDINGKARTDPAPTLGRFAASDMLGADCEPVACSVMAGEDAEAPEMRPTAVRK